jgi:hypothetical protein
MSFTCSWQETTHGRLSIRLRYWGHPVLLPPISKPRLPQTPATFLCRLPSTPLPKHTISAE